MLEIIISVYICALVAAVLALGACFFLDISKVEFLALAITITMVIAAEMINTAKYILSNDETLETYEISEGVVNVVANGNLYYLECNGINLSINVEDRMIIDYKVR